MNILLVTGMFVESEREPLGGMAKAIYQISKGLMKRGHDVRILSASGMKREGEWKYKGVSIYHIRRGVDINSSEISEFLMDIIQREIGIEHEIKRINRMWHVDVIQYSGWYGIGMLHFSNIPSVMRVSSYTKSQLSTNFDKRKVKYLELIERMAVNRMNVVYTPALVTARVIENDTQKRVYVLPTPFQEEAVAENDNLYKEVLNNIDYLLFFGRMSKDKGVLVINECINDIMTRYPSLHIVFIGTDTIIDGKSCKSEIIRSAGQYIDRIHIMNALPHSKLFPIIKKSKAILMPSLMDNLPNSCAEAMALGGIVIGTDGSSLEQYIIDGKNGFLAEIGSADSLLEKIEQCMEISEQERERMQKNAKDSLHRFSEEVFFDHLEELLKRVANKK